MTKTQAFQYGFRAKICEGSEVRAKSGSSIQISGDVRRAGRALRWRPRQRHPCETFAGGVVREAMIREKRVVSVRD